MEEDQPVQNPLYFFKESFSPVVLVLSTPEVDSAFKKNGDAFSLVNLLNVFTTIIPPAPIKIRISDGTNNSANRGTAEGITVTQLNVRWQTMQVFQNQPRFHFLMVQPKQDFPPITSHAQVIKFQQDFLLRRRFTPWFDEYRQKYFRSLGPSPHELFEHPVACLCVATSADKDVVASLKKLYDPKNPPVNLPKYMDAQNVLVHYLFIHDLSSGVSQQDAQAKFAQIQKAFKVGTFHMTTINSLPHPEANPVFNNFKVHIGRQDLEQCQNFASAFVLESLLPFMHTSLVALHDEARSGFGHKWKLWVGNSFASKLDDPNGQRFDIASLEFRERRLADWAFLLGDYIVAYKSYKSLMDIYKSENALLYLASANEMAANCLVMWKELSIIHTGQKTPPATPGTSPNGPPYGANAVGSVALPYQWQDVDKLFEEAWATYSRAARPAWARRASLAHAYWSQWRLQPSAAMLYERLAEQQPTLDSLERALLLQQAGISYLLRQTNTRFRQFAMQTVRAADDFHAANQIQHALSAYRAAHCVYESKQWNGVDDYLHFKIARLAFSLGKQDMAMKFMNLLLESNNQSPEIQNSCLREFLYIFSTSGKGLETDKKLRILPIPNISRSIHVHLSDFVATSSDPQWTAMEENMLELLQPPEKRVIWQLAMKKPVAKERIAVVGENVFVDLELRNPLNVPVQFTQVQLVCSLAPPNTTSPAPDSNTNGNGVAPSFTQSSFDILLGPLEAKKVQFTLQPNVVGTITISGIRFNVCGVVAGMRELAALHVIRVTSAMPRIEPSIMDWPDHSSSLLVGQLHKSTLRLTNSGQRPVVNLAFTMSHPECIISSALDDSQAIAALHSTNPLVQQRGWLARVNLPEPLQPGAFIDIPLWIRPLVKGDHVFKLLFYYESTEKNPDMKHRLQRATAYLRVIASLKLHATVRPDPLDQDCYIVALDVENLMKPTQRSKILPVVSLRALRIVSPNWHASALHDIHYEADEGPQKLSSTSPSASPRPNNGSFVDIQPRESNVLLFKLTRKTKPTAAGVAELIKFSESTQPTEEPLLMSFLDRECIADKLVVTQKRENLPVFDKRTVEEIERDAHIAATNIKNCLHAVLTWEISTRNALCQTNLCSISFVPEAPWMGTSDPKCPLRFAMESPSTLEHDFSHGLCTTTITIRCFNSSPFTPLSIIFEGLTGDLDPTDKNHQKMQKEYFWGGSTRLKLELKPEETTTFDVQVLFAHPGQYNVNRFKFSVQSASTTAPKTKRVVVYSHSQHFVTVTSK